MGQISYLQLKTREFMSHVVLILATLTPGEPGKCVYSICCYPTSLSVYIKSLFADLFSSGICTAIICSGSRHWTTQPCLSLTRAVSTLRKVFGIRLHSTATMVCTSSRGGHCGTGFLCSLLNMADESGIASWEQRDGKLYGKGNITFIEGKQF